MPLSTQEATETPWNIDRTTRRNANAFGYNAASPHAILWGHLGARLGRRLHDQVRPAGMER